MNELLSSAKKIGKKLSTRADELKEFIKAAIHTDKSQETLRDELKACDSSLADCLSDPPLPFLSAVYAFSKAYKKKKEEGNIVLTDFKDESQTRLSNGELNNKAQEYRKRLKIGSRADRRKLKSLGARIAHAEDKYMAYANIALFFPRVSEGYKAVLNCLVDDDLRRIDLESFKKMINLILIYLEAE